MMFRDRTFLTTIIAIGFILLVGKTKPLVFHDNYYTDPIPQSFWESKVFASSEYDIVIVGDSRIYRGVSPEEMQSILTGYRILNFGFSSGGLNPEIYEAAESKLDLDGKRIIVLGVSAGPLQSASMANEQYQSLVQDSRVQEDMIADLFGKTFFEPITYADLEPDIIPARYYYQEPRSGGWIASYRFPANLQLGIRSSRRNYENKQVMPELVDALIHQVRQWRNDDICVYAFRPPPTDDIVLIENELRGFNESEIVARLENAGAQWININHLEYQTYDGSHLHLDSAVQLSHNIAHVIQSNPCT